MHPRNKKLQTIFSILLGLAAVLIFVYFYSHNAPGTGDPYLSSVAALTPSQVPDNIATSEPPAANPLATSGSSGAPDANAGPVVPLEVPPVTYAPGTVYVFAANYDYVDNPAGKPPVTIGQEIAALAAGTTCSAKVITSCSETRSSHSMDFSLDLRRQYVYYATPASLGSIPYTEAGMGFTVNSLHNTAWTQRLIHLQGGSTDADAYYLYAFPSSDQRTMDGPLTGLMSVSAP